MAGVEEVAGGCGGSNMVEEAVEVEAADRGGGWGGLEVPRRLCRRLVPVTEQLDLARAAGARPPGGAAEHEASRDGSSGGATRGWSSMRRD